MFELGEKITSPNGCVFRPENNSVVDEVESHNTGNKYFALVYFLSCSLFLLTAAIRIFTGIAYNIPPFDAALIVGIIIGVWILAFNFTIQEFLGREKYSCDAFLWMSYIGFGLSMGTQSVRLFQHMLKYHFYEELHRTRVAKVRRQSRALTEKQTQNGIVTVDFSSAYKGNLYNFTDREKNKLRWIKRISSCRFASVLVMIVLLCMSGCALGRSFTEDCIYLQGCSGCMLLKKDSVLLLTLSVFFLLWMLSSYYYIREHADPLHICEELKFLIASVAIAIIGIILLYIDPNGKMQKGYWSAYYFFVLAAVTCVGGLTFNKVHLFRRAFVNRSDTQSIEEALKDAASRNFFEKHLVSELCIENLYFWDQANDWKNSYDKFSREVTIRNGKDIVNAYIAQHSCLEINVSYTLRTQIVSIFQQACEQNTKPPKNVFDEAMNETLRLMAPSFARYLNSEYYQQYRKLEEHPRPGSFLRRGSFSLTKLPVSSSHTTLTIL